MYVYIRSSEDRDIIFSDIVVLEFLITEFEKIPMDQYNTANSSKPINWVPYVGQQKDERSPYQAGIVWHLLFSP
jgi:hypothetical protein